MLLAGFFVVVAAFVYLSMRSGRDMPIFHATSTPAIATSTPSTPLPSHPIPSGVQDKPATIPTATTSASVPIESHPQPVSQSDANKGWKSVIATVFWVGESATSDNGYIQNVESAWDEDWAAHFGGVDDPDNRCGANPCGFTPKENPFYVALPYNDLDDNGDKKADAKLIPWNEPGLEKSVLKNRWIEVSRGGKSCFGQWEDVGPFYENDIAYVFGSASKPKNTFGENAGIDLSPALSACLGVDGSGFVSWRHVEANDVPAGVWKQTITTRSSQ